MNSAPSLPKSEPRLSAELEALALIELEKRQRAFPLYHYRPHAKATTFHQSLAKVRIFSGGNRSGKTEAGVVEACAYALGYRPWRLRELGLPEPTNWWHRPADLPPEALCFNTAGVRVQPPIDVFVVTALPIRKGIAEAIYPKCKKYLSPAIASTRMGQGGAPVEVVLKNGSRLIFASTEADIMAFESTNYAATLLDEPPPKAVWSGVRRGSIDQLAPIWITATPIGPNAAWLFHELISVADGKAVGITEVSIYDNPYLSKEAVNEFASDTVMTEAEREARLFGRFAVLADRIYPNFDEHVHIVEPFRPPDDWLHGCVIDPHQVKPWAIAYFAVTPRGAIYFYKEHPSEPFQKLRKDTRSMEEYALLLRQLDGQTPIGIRLIDPNAGPRKEHVRGIYIPSFVDELGKYGLYFHSKLNDQLEFGETMVRRLLAFNPKQPLGPLNRPKLFFTSDCLNLIASMKYYTAKTKPGTIMEPYEDKRSEEFKDFADLVRYVAVSGIASHALADDRYPFENDYPEDSQFEDNSYD